MNDLDLALERLVESRSKEELKEISKGLFFILIATTSPFQLASNYSSQFLEALAPEYRGQVKLAFGFLNDLQKETAKHVAERN